MENSLRYWTGNDSVIDLDEVSCVAKDGFSLRGTNFYTVALKTGGTLRVEGEKLIRQFLEYKKIA